MFTLTALTQYSIAKSKPEQSGKKKKGVRVRNEKVKVSLFADDIILYIENCKDSTKKTPTLLETINK